MPMLRHYGNHCHQSTVNAPFVTLIFGLHMSRFFPKTDAVAKESGKTNHIRDYPDEAQTMSRFAERFREEGIQQGVQQGMQQGLHQGEALVLERHLRLKLGALPDEVQRRIEQASEQTLLTWSERILTANRLDEVLH